MGLVALIVLSLDQLTKWLIAHYLAYGRDERVLIEGFFKLVHWGNTGAAWSLFKDRNSLLALISMAALLMLFLARKHFDSGTVTGQAALGLLFGGILGNLVDRLHAGRNHVIDFIYFYVKRRGGDEIGFPAFNVADSAICVGVGLLFLLSWNNDGGRTAAGESLSQY